MAAKSVEPFTWRNGFREPTSGEPWRTGIDSHDSTERSHYVNPPPLELLTSSTHNSIGLNRLRTWPTLYNGTNSPHELPKWWKPKSEVDVLICGAGPCGLEVALSLVRQGVTFRIVDQAEMPLIAGRADGVQPRFLETLNSWGLAEEVAEEGPLIERTAIYKDGKCIFTGRSHQSDSRYRGLHIITQGQVERIFIRDLYRHQVLVERNTTVTDFSVTSNLESGSPVQATIKNSVTGETETIKAKFLVGSDGASSSIRKRLNIPFEGVSTDIYWGIMDCIFTSDYPHAWLFGSVVSSQHGGCVIIPREDGYIRLYTKLDTSATGAIALKRQAEGFHETGGRVDVHSITPDEVLAQANLIFAPYKLSFAAPLSWFAVWKISERVAKSFSSPDMRVHIAGDAAHVHSVMGAFGLNASILDAANLAWKIGMVAQEKAKLSALLPTYSKERRLHGKRIIRISGSYLRFVCGSTFPLAAFEEDDTVEDQAIESLLSNINVNEEPLEFLTSFFRNHGQFLLGVDAAYGASILNSPRTTSDPEPITPRNGVRAPNPRVCFDTNNTGYLYDKMKGAAIFHVLMFASDLQGPVREQIGAFNKALDCSETSSRSFYQRYGRSRRFNLVLILKSVPFEGLDLLEGTEMRFLRENSTVVYDDRAPDEDAHTTYGVNHAKGAVVVVRPDLWIGISVFPRDANSLNTYFDNFMLPA